MDINLIHSWREPLGIAVTTAASFLVLFGLIRITGKRTLSSLSAFDFVVIIALGSTLAEMMLGEIPFVNGAVALLVILAFQFGLAWGSRKWKPFEHLINAKPTLLYLDGKFLQSSLDREKITEQELLAEIRTAGIFDLSDIKAIVLELNGHVSIVKTSKDANPKQHSLDAIVSDYLKKKSLRG